MGNLDLSGLNGWTPKFENVEGSKNNFFPNGIKGFKYDASDKRASIFQALDTNEDGIVSEMEYQIAMQMKGDDDIITDEERNNFCMKALKYSARRDIDKWFSRDKNRDGQASNVEQKYWAIANNNHRNLLGSKTNEELSQEFGMDEEITNTNDDVLNWLKESAPQFKAMAKMQFGVDLTDEQLLELRKTGIEQLNTWLLKDGDYKNAPFYNQLNLDAYTRLMTENSTESCCGGNVCDMPNTPDMKLLAPGMPDKPVNTSDEMKARLEWASFAIKRDSDGNAVFDENGQQIMEQIMTDEQIAQYKKIVEEVTGKPWDSDGWEVTPQQWMQIALKVNGTEKDETLLQGASRGDILANRQALLKYLEDNNILYEQFKQ